MRQDEFITRACNSWGKQPDEGMLDEYMYFLKKFTPEQLDRIYDACQRECKFFPRIANIYECARNIGIFQKRVVTEVKHEWTEGDCSTCRGEGRVNVWYKHEGKDKTVHAVSPLSDSINVDAPENEPRVKYYQHVYRCHCRAGEAKTIPKGWPRLREDYLDAVVWVDGDGNEIPI